MLLVLYRTLSALRISTAYSPAGRDLKPACVAMSCANNYGNIRKVFMAGKRYAVRLRVKENLSPAPENLAAGTLAWVL